jgi:hypothetical protein
MRLVRRVALLLVLVFVGTVAALQRLNLIRRHRLNRAEALREIASAVAPVLRERGMQIEDLYDDAGLPA